MNLENYLDKESLEKNQHNIKKIFFYRVCGTGMGACACLLKQEGFDVSGADKQFSPPMSTYLESTGMPLYPLSDVNIEFLKQFDLIIVGNSVPKVSEDSKLIESCGVKFTSFPTVLGSLVLSKQNVVAIAGTHGKTTTTYLMVQLLESVGKKPGYFIGGILNERPPAFIGEGSYFIIESDEYDSAYFQKYSKFRQYEADHMILTSLEFDHADIFNSITDIENEFRAALPKITGQFIYSANFESARILASEFDHFKSKNSYEDSCGPVISKLDDKGCEFTMNLGGEDELFKTNLRGRHNIFNLASCIIFLFNEGFKVELIQDACLDLGLVKRRQEFRGYYKDAVVIDDFAHHPRSVELTIESIKQSYPDREMIVVFEPISATARSNVFQTEFEDSLAKADKVIITNPQIESTAKKYDDLDFSKLNENLQKRIKKSELVINLEELTDKINSFVNSNSVLLILSNRTCLGLWESNFVKELKQ
jgi:UDP-N-acetylmuramate: L-alanyl-gamma-D-glutamyl-meso-diaminopimelate ligase